MTKLINEESLAETAKIIKQYVDESSDIDLSKIVNSTSPNARYAISNTDDGIVADYDSSRTEDGVIVGGGTHNSFEITDTGVKLRASQTRVVAGGVTGYDNSIEISEDGVMVNGNAIATLADALTTQETQTLINSILYPATPASYFTFSDGALMGFSAEGQTAYDNGELTELILPSSYSLGELVTEEVTYAELFELEEYCMENGYNFTFVNKAGETISITSEEEFFNNYDELLTLWEENQSITVTMQNQKFVDGTDVGVTSLSTDCFYGCSALTSINIPDSVTSLGVRCFSGCSALTSITLPDSVTSLDNGCFYSCSALTSITLPNNVTSLGIQCFDRCSALTSITLPNSVTSLGDYCFQNCSALTTITVQSSNCALGGTNVFDNTNNCPIYVPAEALESYKVATNWSTYADRLQAIVV